MDFKNALDTNTADIEKPPLPPTGTYVFQITKYDMPESKEGRDGVVYDFLHFDCVAVEATDSVDPDALAQFGALKNIRLRHSFIFNTQDQAAFDQTMWSLKRFLEGSLKQEPMPVKQAIATAVNERFLGDVVWKPDRNDKEIFHANIGKTAPVD